jgi:hypothetical protein
MELRKVSGPNGEVYQDTPENFTVMVFKILLLNNYYLGDQIEVDEMDGTCGT